MTWAARARARQELLLRSCRRSAAAFIEYVIAHEKTGKRLRNAAHHVEWQAFLDANKRAVLWAPVEHGKTQQAIGRVQAGHTRVRRYYQIKLEEHNGKFRLTWIRDDEQFAQAAGEAAQPRNRT